jgi:isopentenyl diphosphate isomerase/L-lactate dehydrogenase-like FMN-dependent dehydrogenase
LLAQAEAAASELISSPADAINVFDFEAVCRKNVPPAHFGYMASGIDSELTLRANREVFSRIQLRPRRLRDVSHVDTSVELVGVKWDTPIFLAPVGGQRAYEPGGEATVARAAKARRTLQILSTQTSTSVEAVTEARGAPVWYQLYATPSWEIAQVLVKRAEKAGCPVVAVTVDRAGGRNQETFFRLRRTDPRQCSACHAYDIQGSVRTKPMFDGLDVSKLPNLQSANMTWDFVHRLKDFTTMKVVLKGIMTKEDAALALQHGADGIIVSNHGGRAEDSGLATMDCLPDIMGVVGDRMPVLIDSGFRRGTDVFKALALGARAVCVGRPYIWGLGAFGQPGVERVLELLQTEFHVAMQQCGVRSVKEIDASYVRMTSL